MGLFDRFRRKPEPAPRQPEGAVPGLAPEADTKAVILLGRDIGLDAVSQAVVERFGDRMTFVEGDFSPSEGVWLIPHKTPGLAAYGEADEMYIARGGKLEPDDYAHEQSLVIETDQGLVIFNSCSHGGADNIIREVGKTFPGKRLLALVGGFHLFRRTDGEVRALARRIRDTGVGAVYTGHCTGTRALEVLAEELGSLVHPFHTGLVMEF